MPIRGMPTRGMPTRAAELRVKAISIEISLPLGQSQGNFGCRLVQGSPVDEPATRQWLTTN